MPVNWTPENDRKLFLGFLHNISPSAINADALAKLIPGATRSSIQQHICLLRKEAQAVTASAATSVVVPAVPKKRVRRSRQQIAAAAAANGNAVDLGNGSGLQEGVGAVAKLVNAAGAAAGGVGEKGCGRPGESTRGVMAEIANEEEEEGRKRKREAGLGDGILGDGGFERQGAGNEDVVPKKRGREKSLRMESIVAVKTEAVSGDELEDGEMVEVD